MRSRWFACLATVLATCAVLGFAPRSWVVEDCEPIPFSDPLDYSNQLIDSLPAWRATIGPGAPSIQNNQALIAINSNVTMAYIQPVCDGCVQQHGLFYPLDRVCRQFTQVEFDLLPTVTSENTLGEDDGKLSVYFASHETDTGALDLGNIVGPAVAIDLICRRTQANPAVVTVRPEIRAKSEPDPPGDLDGTVEAVTLPTFTLPNFTGVNKRLFRFEFGWDWYVNPGQHENGVDQIGKPFLFVRLQYFDGTTWRNPMVEDSVPANPRVDPGVSEDRNFDGTGGWIKLGTDTRYGDSNLGHNNVEETACDFRDWKAATTGEECPPVYPYVFAERLGNASVDWRLDNFAIRGVSPEPLTLFVNTVGYDTAAPQWALIRPNRTLFRDQTSMDGMEIATAELRAGNGDLLRSLAAGNLTIGPARHCFQELDDMETFPFDFGDSPEIYWRRIDWTAITDAKNDCYLKLTGTAPDSKPFTIKSHTFDLAEEIWWTPIWSALAIANEQARRGTEWEFLDGGWSDAGNNNAEGRAHGLFISGLAHMLRERRGELSTAEMGDLIAAMKFGADWILKLVEENTDLDADERWTAHEGLDQGCTEPDASHFFDPDDQFIEDQEGHIWEEHHSRPRGSSGAGDVNDGLNNIDRMYMCLYGLTDVAWTLNAFDAQMADTYRAQADKSRNYLYWLENPKCTFSPDAYIAYRLQAPLDVLFYDAGSGLPANTNQPDSTPADNLDLARRKLLKDLEQFPINENELDLNYREWASCNHDVIAPQAPPWLGLLQMRDRLQSGVEWDELLSTLADRWYVNDTHPSEAQNVLHVPRFWFNNFINHQQYQGNVQRSCNKVLYETGATAQLAMALGPSADSYEVLQLLTVGGINWLMGIHYGLRGRYVLPYSDREWECGAFLPNVGSAQVVQNTIALHYWEAPSVLAGQGGELSQFGDSSTGPDLPPWSYSPQSYGNTETFIQRDGPMLVACESATRLFHPLRIYEAEAGTLFNLGSAPHPTIVSNNDAAAQKLNGGSSYVGFTAGEGVRFTLWDPAQGTGAPDPNANERKYWILLRVGNVSNGDKPAKVKILQGTTPKFNGTVSVPQTFHQHEYVVLKFAASVTLYNNQAYTCEVTFPNGDVTFDRFELKSRGK